AGGEALLGARDLGLDAGERRGLAGGGELGEGLEAKLEELALDLAGGLDAEDRVLVRGVHAMGERAHPADADGADGDGGAGAGNDDDAKLVGDLQVLQHRAPPQARWVGTRFTTCSVSSQRSRRSFSL